MKLLIVFLMAALSANTYFLFHSSAKKENMGFTRLYEGKTTH